MDLIIRNGMVVTASGSFESDVAVDNGRIEAVGKDLKIKADTETDASGLMVLPGALDAHTHMAMPFGGTTSADSYLSGTRAAVCGGVTTVFDYPVQHEGGTIMDLVNSKKAVLEKEACCDYAMHCCITSLNGGQIINEMETAVKEGVTSFKCFLVYKKENMMVDDGTLVRLMLRAKALGAMINVHAENPDLIDLNIENFRKAGTMDAYHHYLSRPEYVEAEADKRAVHWASHLDAPLYLVHMADKEGLEATIKAKEEGHRIYVETCPQYLEFNSEVYKRPDGRNFICSPPMKGEESRQALWKAIKMGFIDTVATDHCPFQSYEKDWGRDDFTKVPNGCAGVENLYPYMLDAANSGKITFEKAVELCSTNVAKIFGCPDKGAVEPGKDADIVLYDRNRDFTVSVKNMHSDCDHTIWEGKKLHGYPVKTYLRGKLVYEDGEFKGTPGEGKYVHRIPSVG